jgi:hypothetical protein
MYDSSFLHDNLLQKFFTVLYNNLPNLFILVEALYVPIVTKKVENSL